MHYKGEIERYLVVWNTRPWISDLESSTVFGKGFSEGRRPIKLLFFSLV